MICEVHVVQRLLGKKWTTLILENLKENKAMSFNDLENSTPGITAKLLSKRLTDLIKEGLVEKEIFRERPLKTNYRISQKGSDLLLVLVKMKEWGMHYNAVPENCDSMNCNACARKGFC